ncbi:ribonuclease R [Coralloluteibacterium stylophorae]|uniref:Ribonuclease R n=2 Tax=Coralloluteibacterium stylophorae TaxID=1776034 RepID=A0AAP2G0F8_9GAMM|nr:ribonuclease R [Coralloluteibacterium stylophorae]MBS7459017.1 ribonuclease R [Coralloluteibacterium stylophorae]
MSKPTKRGKGRASRQPGWLPEPAPAAASAKRASRRSPAAASGAEGAPAAGQAPTKRTRKDKPPRTPAAAARAAARRQDRGDAAPGYVDPHAERESLKYENPIASREVILSVLGEAEGPLDAEALADILGLTAPDRFFALTKRLGAMLRDGQLLANRRGGYAVATKLDLIPGTVIANPEGFGFLRTDVGGDDLFLPPAELRKAMHGDRVLASVTGVDRRGRREGAIVEVLERRTTRLIGRFIEENGIGFVDPDDRRLTRNVMIPPDARGEARVNQLVICEITRPQTQSSPAFGRVLTVLGDRLTPSLVVTTAIHGHEIPDVFPPEVLDQAAAVPVEVDQAVAAARVDLREVPLVTIDGEDAKDFDDAVWCEPNRSGFRLIVAIADVSHYVKPGTPLDDEAQKRATSVYFPGFVVPMLPESLSNGICSLMPKVDRMCFVCDMQVDRDGNVRDSRFYEAVMRSHARLTYTQVWNAVGDDALEADRDDARGRIGVLMPQVERLHQLYQVLAKARQKRGAIEFETSETRFVIGPAGEVVQAGMLPRNDAHKLIEECMIAANVEAARHLMARGIPAPFRIHERPPEQKYADLLEFLQEFKLKMPAWSKVRPKDFTALLKKIRERPDAPLIESVLLRSQSLAVYSAENVGHFGLALEAYAHFTSPIRRYPDLLVHRAIKHALAGGKASSYGYSAHDMVALALQCSERERRATEAEREVDERFRAAWMEKHVGSEFDGTISGVASFGVFVELDDSKVNGLIHVTQLPHDYYHFDPVRKLMSGERRGMEFRLGDRVRIQVLRASVEDRRIDFRLAGEERERASVKSGRRRKG